MMELEQEIRAAFEDVLYPGDDEILACSCEDCQFLSARLRGKRWQDIGFDDVIGNSSGWDETLSTLSPQGFHYYLPGLMLLVIEDDAEDTLSDSVISRLTAHEREPAEVLNRRREVIQLLTETQRSAVESFANWLRQVDSHCPAILDALIKSLKDQQVHPYSMENVNDWVKEHTNEKDT